MWVWIVTIANAIVAVLLLLALYGIVLALAVLAPYIYTWPLFAVLLVGVALSIVGLKLSLRVASRVARRVGYLVNGCALALNVVVILGVAAIFIGSTKERVIIPEGYKGDIYVIHGAADGQPSKTRWGLTYRVPPDGILRTRESLLRGWTTREYYYERQDSSLERIRDFWPTTIPRTPENLTNDKDIGVFFPRTGTFTDSTGCSVQFEQFYVGTKAHLLSKYREVNIGRYILDHPVGCSK
jgi:hypothetical protein